MKCISFFKQGSPAIESLIPMIVFSLITLSGCAHTIEPPSQEIGAAKMAISQAERSELGEFSKAQVELARNKLASAKDAMEEERFVLAKRYAEQAIVDANLAQTAASLEKTNEHFMDSREAVSELRKAK